jgi:hypothetical protein
MSDDVCIVMRLDYYLKNPIRPVTFRLPKPGQRDPYFGLSRSKYYELEKAGKIQMRRLCDRGNIRGTTLIIFDQVLNYVLSQTEDGLTVE